ncbi:MAG: 6-phosphogluconolactonase, partial [Phycisphaeraceae bacterium]|nr:6-phosphogluconolactonase [Phycisphaeraceae bacterium]
MNEPQGKFEAYQATRGLRGKRVIVPDVEDLVDELAGAIFAAATQRTAQAGAFHLALSGGRSPEVLFRRLMLDPRYRLLPWDRTHLWLVDDRCVPADDPRSNSTMIREFIVDHVTMEPDQFHPMPVMEPDGDR